MTTRGDPLAYAAINSDVFVIATAAARDAASIFIEAHHPKCRPTIHARSQGSTRLLDAIQIFLGNSWANCRNHHAVIARFDCECQNNCRGSCGVQLQ
jgi:hypothetical protein